MNPIRSPWGPEVYCPGPNSSMPPYDQVFEPNRYVVIENRGRDGRGEPVGVVANGQRDWWSVETMAEENRRHRRRRPVERTGTR